MYDSTRGVRWFSGAGCLASDVVEWLVFALVWLPIMAGAQWLAIRRSKQAAVILEGWAADHGHQLLEARRSWLYPGPFFWNRGQAVFFIRLVTPEGSRRMGWARVGRGHALFPVSDVVEVRFDDERGSR